MKYVLAVLIAAGAAHAGRFDGDAALDVFHADSIGAGDPALVTAQELGAHLRLRLFEFDDDLKVQATYDGREPILGAVQTTPLRILSDAYVSYRAFDLFTTTLGRFAVPSAVALVVDGARVQLHLPLWLEASGFVGRRGLTSSRREAGIDTWLFTAGGSAGFHHPLVAFDVLVDYAQDQALLGKAGASPQPTGGFDALAMASSRPFDWLILGGHVAFVQQANYVLGPTWASLQVEQQVINLWNGTGYVEYRPWSWLRFGYDGQYQKPAVVRSAILVGAEPARIAEVVDPQFLDNRAKIAVAPFALGWLRGGVRHRWRPDRQELRYFGEIDADHLAPWGFYATLRAMYDDVIPNLPSPTVKEPDRFHGSFAVGWRAWGFDVSTGLNDVERSAVPLSARGPAANQPVDLQPFVLEAQRVFFARGAYEGEFAWVAADVEKNLDANELRAFLQVGGRWELAW